MARSCKREFANGQTAILPKMSVTSETFKTDMPVGEILRRERIRYNLTLPQVEQDLKIRLKILEALETGNYTNITGGKPYVIGHTRTYAEYLRLDGDKVIDLLKIQMGGQQPRRPAMVMPVAANDSAVPDNRLLWISAAVIAVVILGGAIISSFQKTDAIPSVPDALKEPLTLNNTQPANTVAQAAAAVSPAAGVTVPAAPSAPGQPVLPASAIASASPTAAGTGAAPALPIYASPSVAAGTPVAGTPVAGLPETAATTPSGTVTQTVQTAAADAPPLVMKALQDSWMEVRTGDGRVVYSGLLKSGKSLVLREDRNDLELTTGNAGGIEIYIDGQAIAPLGNIGEVKKNVLLDPEKLRNRG